MTKYEERYQSIFSKIKIDEAEVKDWSQRLIDGIFVGLLERGDISLDHKGGKIVWKYNKKTPSGYKIEVPNFISDHYIPVNGKDIEDLLHYWTEHKYDHSTAEAIARKAGKKMHTP